MLKTVFFLFLLLSVELFAQKRYEINAMCVDVDQDLISADEGAVLHYDGKYIYAKKVIYDSKNQVVMLEGDVFFIDNNRVTLASDRAKVQLDEEEMVFLPFYFIDDESKLWIKADKGSKEKQRYFADSAITSSCDPDDPDWAIKFSSMKYDADRKLLDMFNPVLYIKDLPILYLPYMRISTNKERRSGLLRPIIGYSDDDGVFYEQPLFIAPSLWWDLELNPQMRTQRSKGIYATLRFVNSESSNGYLRVGNFESKASYKEKHNLQRGSHSGVEFFYEDSNLFKFLEDGFYFDGAKISDIDYLDLTTKEPVSASVTGELVESKMNYFARNEEYYVGTYLRYFDDTSKESNKNTIQLLPRIQAHRFSDRLLSDNILYSLDMTYSNYTRQEGVKAEQLEFSLPLTFYTQIFNDYLNFSLSENFYTTRVHFTRGYDSYKYYRLVHHLGLFSDLIKPYKNGYHNLNFGINYTLPGYEKEDIKYDNLSKDQQDFFKITTPRKGYNLYLKQYFYNFNEEEIFYHQMNQPYSYDSYGKRMTGDMENSFRYRVSQAVNLSLNTFYSHFKADFSRILSSISVKKRLYDMTLRHLYTNNFKGKRTSYLTAAMGYNFFQYRTFAKIDYDYTNKFAKQKTVGLRMNKNCWDYTITLSEDVTPSLTTSSKNSKKDRRVMFEINLVPLGGFAQSF